MFDLGNFENHQRVTENNKSIWFGFERKIIQNNLVWFTFMEILCEVRNQTNQMKYMLMVIGLA